MVHFPAKECFGMRELPEGLVAGDLGKKDPVAAESSFHCWVEVCADRSSVGKELQDQV